MENDKNKIIKKLDGANMDIDLTTKSKDISWNQDKCVANQSNIHRHFFTTG